MGLPDVVFMHLKSCREEGGQMKYCRISEGAIDYRPILAWLASTYSGYYGLEYEEPSDVEQGTKDDLAALKSLLAV
jgi:hypothetical protein